MKAILSNGQYPDHNVVTVPFPIPEQEYDHILDLLRPLGIGDAIQRDCHLDELDFGYSALRYLEGQAVNLDELDYLAKRLESFDKNEAAQFQATLSKLGLTDMTDIINLTFCCQQATVITDFSDLEKVGKAHFLTVQGGCAPKDELDALDGYETALLLIDSGAGVVTPYGVLYDNGMKLEQVYDGMCFPDYHYKPDLLTLGRPLNQSRRAPIKSPGFISPPPRDRSTAPYSAPAFQTPTICVSGIMEVSFLKKLRRLWILGWKTSTL